MCYLNLLPPIMTTIGEFVMSFIVRGCCIGSDLFLPPQLSGEVFCAYYYTRHFLNKMAIAVERRETDFEFLF